MNQKVPYVLTEFRKGRGTRDEIANCHWILGKARVFQKNICFIANSKVFDSVEHKNCGKFLNCWEYQTTWPVSWESCMQVQKQQLELDNEQQNGSKLGKEYVKAVYCQSAFLTYIRKHYVKTSLDEAQDEIKISGRSINKLTHTDDTTLQQKAKRN